MTQSILDASTETKASAFRAYLPDLSRKRFAIMQNQDAHEYVKMFEEEENPPWIHALYLHWRKLLAEPFRGVTTDGMPLCCNELNRI